MANRTSKYTDAEKSRAYVIWMTNGNNLRGTERESGVPRSTLRDWIADWEMNGPPDTEQVEPAVMGFVDEATRVRDKALAELERSLPNASPSALISIVKELTDRINVASGLATSRVEHAHSLPPAEEIKELVQGFVTGVAEAAQRRREEIIEAEVVEQAPRALPAPRD